MKIYTKTGDNGETGLLAGPRVSKDHVRVEAYGEVDEINALLGLARSERLPQEIDRILVRVQHELFNVGAELACPYPEAYGLPMVDLPRIDALEAEIDRFEDELPPLRQFILPGGSRASALLHVARTVCRRAERRVVSLRKADPEHVSENVLGYLNRLGDLLFLLARAANHALNVDDVPWSREVPPDS
ncbi:MAG: cob(I)yrinic acid a,c-diamide adenosyltransferase [Planctomycetes bacterium]|nr:cob(I)yrinic acid a,c-diamide adenosyltransferase [Planctomycetota bacterium]